MQLLKIKTIPFEYDMKINNAKLTVPQIDPAKFEMNTIPAKVDIKTEDVKIRMDSSEMRRSIGMKTPADRAREAPAQTQQTANKTTSEYVKQGNAMTQRGMTIAEYIKQKIISESVVQTGMEAIPSHPVDVSWEPATIKTDVKKGRLETNWEKSAKEMEFIPSSITLEVRQLADVEIEYLGGFRYVPPSSDPNYEEK